ncbi:MAG: glucose-6-phosphate isomerase [Bacillota bacterium]|nr:glucose-6-phosphate isomerase [Bacillota bacterium]
MELNINLENMRLTAEELAAGKPDASSALDRLWSGREPMTGWVQAPLHRDEALLEELLNAADLIKEQAELLIVIGVGGSYMGAKAAIEALPKTDTAIDVKFAGINFCSEYHRQLSEELHKKETALCVISKSGNTLEIRAAFDFLKAEMIKKYGAEETAERIVTITDRETGSLRAETESEGYLSFEVPDDIGGRYSAMTPAGLLPMAVAGIDIRALLEGAEAMAVSPAWDTNGMDYAIARKLMMERGKKIEVVEFYDPRLNYLGEWIKQLYGESEGKEGKGLFPATLSFSRDLHSMGQFLQQGSQIFFETVIAVDEYDLELEIPQGPLKGKTFEDLNRAAFHGVLEAHKKSGIPVAEIHLLRLDALHYGQLLYFLETSCAVTAMLMDVDPFDQPGVEDYKREMHRALERED